MASLRKETILTIGAYLLIVIVGFLGFRNSEDNNRKFQAEIEARCITGNQNRTLQIKSDIAARDAFILNRDSLLNASGIDINNPPSPDTERGQQVQIYIESQTEVIARLDESISSYTYVDCNSDGQLDSEDGIEQ